MPATFPNTRMAIQVLRQGKKDQRWFAAAEFLIEKASPEVLLMLEVGREMHILQSRQQKQQHRWRPLIVKALIFTALGLLTAGLTLLILKGLPICTA